MATGGNLHLGQDEPLREAFRLLLRAHHHALDTNRDVWDFAVEISEFLRLGVSRSDLRWMVCKEYVSHGRERTVVGQKGRDFQVMRGLMFGRRTCLVLTPAGVEFSRSKYFVDPEAANEEDVHARLDGADVDGKTPVECASRPRWDRDRHTLRVGSQLVKEYKVPSPNQETILTAFEEDGWPPRIDDPLPMVHGIEPKRRLQDTVKSLNRNQRVRLVRFMGDGTGEGVRWEFANLYVPTGVTEHSL